MTLRERIARLYRLHPRGERAETGPRRGSWAPREGLVDLYGDPARGFAGGYVAGAEATERMDG